MKKTTIAIIGCGRIANNAHLPALTKLDDVNIKYVCDIISEKAQAVQQKFKCGEVIADYKLALADPEVDAVYVLTPNYSHYTVSMDALRAGKHVFCEKPITVNYELAKEMADEAIKQDRLLNIGVCNRYNRSVEMLKQMNDEGKFGELYHVYCSFRSYRSIPGLGGAFTTKAESGGGVLIDWGVHFLDLILYILGEPKLLTATCDTYNKMATDMKKYVYTSMWAEDTKNLNGTNDVDDMVSGYIRTEKANISFNGAWAQNVGENDMFIDFLGTEGGARLSYGKEFVWWTVEDGCLIKKTPIYKIPDQFWCEDRAFIDAIAEKVHTKTYIDRILNSMLLLDTLYKSADEKREISLR